MRNIDLFFPPRRRDIELSVPSRVTEGKLWIQNLPFLIYIRTLAGIAANGLMRVPGLEKLIRGRYGIRQGGRMDTPGLLKEGRVRDGLRMGGRGGGELEKTAAGKSGILAGARASAGIDTAAGSLKSGVLAGERLYSPEAEKSGPVRSGMLDGVSARGEIENTAAVRGGAVLGGAVTAARESAAAGSYGVRMGGGVSGGAVVVRLRKLAELDDSTLAELDGRTLGDLDYVIVEN